MIENCGECPHVGSQNVMGLPVYACFHRAVLRPFIVPQHSTLNDDNTSTVTFHRVPMSCPLPDTMVRKQPESERIEGGET